MVALSDYRCPRCGHTTCEVGHDYAMNREGTRFATVTCARCRHTEFFAAKEDELLALLRLIKEQHDLVGVGAPGR